jgi:hypothetical protein
VSFDLEFSLDVPDHSRCFRSFVVSACGRDELLTHGRLGMMQYEIVVAYRQPVDDAIKIRKIFRQGGSVVFAVEEPGKLPLTVSRLDIG